MKKFVALSFVLLGIIFLAGCTEQTNQNINTIQEAAQAQEIVYTNSEYGFTLTLPPTWEGYTTQLGPKADGVAGTGDSVAFSLPDQTSIFVIEIFPETLWDDIQQEEGPTPTYLAKNSEYVFGYSMAQDAKNETMVARIAEIKDILKTFKLNSNPSAEIVELKKIQNDLGVSLMRGDAELAPTYTEFITTVSAISKSLNTAVANLETIYKDKEGSESIVADIAELKVVANDLQMSVQRGDADTAPTYEEFYNTVHSIQPDLEKVVTKLELEQI